jgi:hypothetical protein
MDVMAWRSIFPLSPAVPKYVLKAYLSGHGAVPGVLLIFPGIPFPVPGVLLISPGIPFPVSGVPGVPFPVSRFLPSSSFSLFFQPFGLREVPLIVFLLSYEGFFFMVVVVV